jgi:anti-sigma factor RsiW
MSAEGRNKSMKCREAEILLLEADPYELRGEGDGALATHLRRCEACRRSARRILEGERALDDALRARAARRSVDHVLREVRATLAEGREDPAGQVPGAPRSIRWKVAVPLAAAAVAAIALWSRGPGDESTPVSPVVRPAWSAPPSATASTAAEAGERGSGLRVEADERFALLPTESPTISVVWFY